MPKEKQKELYRSGLLKMYFKINSEKYEKSKGLNLNFELDKFIHKKERPAKYINISLGESTKQMLKEGHFGSEAESQYLQEQILELEEQLEDFGNTSEYRLVMDEWTDAYDEDDYD